ncbi:MAG: ABC transporter permease [Lewinella sp.]|nr:ABC transporter permease [Lewinella sp.]
MTNLKIAFRHLWKNKFYTFINLSGLAIGMAACWLIAVFVRNELGYDRLTDQSDRICQVNVAGNFGGMSFITSNSPPPAGSALAAEYPEVEAFTRLFQPGDQVLKADENQESRQFTEGGGLAVDSNFLEVFSFPLRSGKAAECLRDPGSIVLTESTARKYFGPVEADQAIGRTIAIDNRPFRVSAVLEDLPGQSSIQFDFLTPVAAYDVVRHFSWSWVWLQMETYVLLTRKPTSQSLTALEAKFPGMVRKYAAGAFKRIGQPLDEFLSNGGKWDFSLKPLEKVHLYSEGVGSRINNLGSIKDVYIFATVGLMILLLACVNFMNLTTARSLTRAREVGVRKVLGSKQQGLVRQFLAESMLCSGLAWLLDAALVQALLPAFNQLSGESFTISHLFAGWTGVLAVTLPVAAGLLGGLYPALYLSNMAPINILKNKLSGAGNAWLKNGLVVFQFAISIAMIICTAVVLLQIDYSRNQSAGLNKENVVVINNAQRLREKGESLRQQLEQLPGVVLASLSTDLPAKNAFGDFYEPETDGENPGIAKDLTLNSYMVDYDFVPAMGIEMLEGRNFSRDFPADSAAVILNETAVRTIGWKDPVGRFMVYPGNGNQRFKVIGVMKDFHAQSFRAAIEPFGLFHYSSKTYDLDRGYLAVRIRPGEESRLLPQIQDLWQVMAPDTPFSYSFLDEDFNALYRSEAKLGAILSVFTGLSLFIACLGLFGLIAMAAEQRTREIGIRKVLGASITGLVGLLSRDFLQLVVAAAVIASPVAWYFMDQWLQGFAYRIEMTWWIFAVAGLAAVVIAFATVGFHAVKAALANPVESLRNE